MKKILLLFSLFTLHYSLVFSQDTTKPFIMNQNYYDSTLRALKHADEVKKKDSLAKVDSLKAHEKHVTDSINKVLRRRARHDSIKNARINDSIDRTQKEAFAKYKKDSIKYYRQHSTGFAALSFGIGLPVSDYANIAAAAAGSNISLSADFPGKISRFGWAFKFDWGWNGINQPQYLHVASEYDSYQLTYTMNAPSHDYTYYTLLVGPCYSLPKGKFSVDVRMLFGALTGNSPATTYNVKDTLGNNVVVNHYRSMGRAFAFDIGFGLRYRIIPHLCAMFTFDYMIAKPSMEQVSSTFVHGPSGIAPVAAEPNVIIQTFGVNQINLGIGYTLGERNKKQ